MNFGDPDKLELRGDRAGIIGAEGKPDHGGRTRKKLML
jgi:hypothetical protein